MLIQDLRREFENWNFKVMARVIDENRWSAEPVLSVNEALEQFSQHAPQKAELVKLRYFAGMGLKEAGDVLGISEPTAVRWWTYSKTWLYHAIKQGRTPAPRRSAHGS